MHPCISKNSIKVVFIHKPILLIILSILSFKILSTFSNSLTLFKASFTEMYILIFGSVPLGLKIILQPSSDSNSITFDLGKIIFSESPLIKFFFNEIE